MTSRIQTQAKPTSLVMLEEQLQWAYEGSQALAGRIDWARVSQIQAKIEEFKKGA